MKRGSPFVVGLGNRLGVVKDVARRATKPTVRNDPDCPRSGEFLEDFRAAGKRAVFREGIGIFQQSGALPPAALDELLEKVASLDMDEVRKQVAEQQAASD